MFPPRAGERSPWSAADNLEVFLNGLWVNNAKGVVQANFTAGKNRLAVFASHNGRNKAFKYLGPLDDFDRKGLYGPVTLELDGTKTELKGWRMRGGPGGDPFRPTNWKAVSETRGVPAFYRATFVAKPPGKQGGTPYFTGEL